MSNISISAQLGDGSLMPFIENGTCRDACRLITDSRRPPVQQVQIVLKTGAGRVVEVTVPNSDAGVAQVTVDGKTV
jgi:hypothetical protein